MKKKMFFKDLQKMNECFMCLDEKLTSEDEDFFGVEFSSGEVGTWKIKDKKYNIMSYFSF